MADDTNPEPLAHTVNVVASVSYLDVGSSILAGGLIACEGCGAAVPMCNQAALRAHVTACEPLRRIR